MRVMPMSAGYSASVSYLAYGLEMWPVLATSALLLLLAAGVVHGGFGAVAAIRELGGFPHSSEKSLKVTAWTWALMLAILMTPAVGRLMLEKGNVDPTFYPSYQRLFARYLPFLHPQDPRARY